MRDNFTLAHTFTARWEGGLSDHEADPGGITNHGISLRWVTDLARQAKERCLRDARQCDTCPRPWTRSWACWPACWACPSEPRRCP